MKYTTLLETKVGVHCAICGNSLCDTTEVKYREEPEFHVTPCNHCLEAAWHEGYAEGFEVGMRYDPEEDK